jgi:heterodisulfide reductase subunit D
MLYFRGCVVREKLPSISNATEKILEIADIDYTVLDNESCCGSFLMRTGFKKDAEKVMKENLQDILATNEKTVLVSCAGCYNTLKNDYKALFDVELNVVHTSELIKDLIDGNRIQVKSTGKTVTYHDPCHLGRHSGIYEEPRDIIKTSADLVEMVRNRERSRCCGAGSGVKSAFPELALDVADKRIQDAEETKAEILTTTCSFCILNLENALKKRKKENDDGSVLRIMDLTELILMGIEG